MAVAYPYPNVNPIERVLTAGAGLGLLWLGVRTPRMRRPLLSIGSAVLLRSVTGYCLGYATAGVVLGGRSTSDTRRALGGARGVHLVTTLRIARTPAAVYTFWRDLTQLSRVLPSSVKVNVLNTTDSQWTMDGAGVPIVRWTARIINDIPGRLIAWKTIGDAGVPSAGSVSFDAVEGGLATDVHVKFQYAPPLGRAGAALADAFGGGADATVRLTLDDARHLLEQGRRRVPPEVARTAEANRPRFTRTVHRRH